MKILKKLLLALNIENKFKLIPVTAYVPQWDIIFKKRKRFTWPLLKPVVFALTLVVAGLLFSGKAYATTTVTAIAVGGQSVAVTYGTGGAPTYTITLTKAGGGVGNETISLAWTGATPSPITITFTPASPYNPNGLASVSLKITTSATTPAGSYPFKISNKDNNSGVTTTSNGTLTIGAKPLTITATGPTKTYGTALTAGPSATNFTAPGTAPGETVTSVTLTPDANGLAAATPVGTAYVVTPSAPTGTGGFLASNYNITFVNYNGTVAKAPLTITASNQTKTYGSAFAFAGTEFTTSGLLGSDAVTSVTLTSAGAAATATVAGSPYSITPSAATGSGLTNYTITYVNGTMTVNTATLTVSGATASNKTYDGTTTATVSGGTLTGIMNGDAVSVSTTGTFASSGVGGGIIVTIALTGAGAGNYTLTQPGITANINTAPLTITATGPTKTYGTTITTGTSSSNYTATGTVAGETVTSVTLTADANGQTATAPVGTTYVVTPSAPTGTGGFLASNYTITYVNFSSTVTAAALTITATGPSLGFGQGFTNGPSATNFVTSATAVTGETVTSVTLTGVTTVGSNPITATTAVGTAYTITPSAATGTGGFLASNYTITYVVYNDNIRAFLYTWTGAGADNNWTTTANWSSVPGGGTFPQTSNDDVQIGVAAYTGAQQPTISAGSIPISSLTLGTNGSTGVTLTINSGNTLTVSSDITVNSGSSTVNLVNNGSIVVTGGYTNNSGAVLNASTSTGSLSIAGGYNNTGTSTFGAGTVSVTGNFNNIGTTTFGAGAVTLTGTYTNSGTNTFGSGAVTFSGSFTNSTTGTVTFGTGAVTFANAFDSEGNTTFGTGLVTYSSTSSSYFVFIGKSKTITYYNVAFTGGGNYHFKTNGGGSGQFKLASTGVMTLSNNTQVGAANAQFTLLSDANGSATIAALPAGCQISGTVNVQRFIAGGVASARGYRLLSPSTFSATDTHGNNIYSISYLLNSTYISGTAFTSTAINPHSKTGNPSLYLLRENLVPSFLSFLTSNYRGIESLASDPYYLINLDSDTLGTQYDIPVGNGFLFFFRGGTGTVNPFTAGSTPASATLTSSGTLNQGAINVTNWYNESLGNTGLLYTTTDNGGDPTIVGMNLVGNPYPSTIDWDTFSNTNPAAAIYGPGLSGAIYLLNPGTQAGTGNYGSYIAGIGGTNNATNLIASGVGFIAQATQANGQLTFTENAKVNTQVSGPALFLANKQTLSAVVKQQIRMQMQLDSLNTDEILINFNPNTKAGFNIMEDARYKIGTGKVSLASVSADNIPLAINQLPLDTKGNTIPLKVGATASGSYTLKLESITGVPQLYDAWLKDAVTKDSINLRSTDTYNFTITTTDSTTFGSNRFKLILEQNPALAYKLLSFDGQKTGKHQVQLNWSTQNEANYTNFTIERSTDNGKTYDVIGSLAASGAGAYSLVDPEPQKGDNLYHLKTVDYWGNVTFSNVIDEQFQDNGNNKASRLSLYPNPAINTINLTIDPKSQGNSTYDIRISNSTGKVVKSATISDVNWQNNVSGLLTGTYLIEVVDKKDNSIVGQTKFVKL